MKTKKQIWTKLVKASINLDNKCPKIKEQTEWFFGYLLGIITTISFIVITKLLINLLN